MRVDPVQGFASVDGVHRNVGLPSRSTGGLLADGLQQTAVPKPVLLEAYNVEKSTAAVLAAGDTGKGTLLGNMLEDTATALGGTITKWEPVKVRAIWHLRIHIDYP